MAFKKAVREKVKAKVAISGPAGGGKSLSSLLLARGLVGPKGRMAVIDTENRSALYYAGSKEFPEIGDFDHDEIRPPYTAAKYIAAINGAMAGGYDVVIVDSLSHIWMGQGGILESVGEVQARGGNKFAAWKPGDKSWNDLLNAVLYSPIHLIATMRSKMAYAEEKDEGGKAKMKKLGLAPQVRDGAEYEFAIVLDIDKETHTAAVTAAGKDRTGLFDGKFFKITPAHGAALAEWLDAASAEAPAMSVDDCPIEYDDQPQARPVNGNGNGGHSRMEQVVGDRLPEYPAPAPVTRTTTQGPVLDMAARAVAAATLEEAKSAAKAAGYTTVRVVAPKLAEFSGRPEATTWEQLHPAEYAAVAEGFRRLARPVGAAQPPQAAPAQPAPAGAA